VHHQTIIEKNNNTKFKLPFLCICLVFTRTVLTKKEMEIFNHSQPHASSHKTLGAMTPIQLYMFFEDLGKAKSILLFYVKGMVLVFSYDMSITNITLIDVSKL